MFRIPHLGSEVNKGNVSLQHSVMKRGDLWCSHLFVLFLCVISNGCCACWCILFLFWSAPLFITFYISRPLKYEAIAFPSQMSYRLTFKFLSEQSDYLIFVLNLTEVSHYNVFFLFFVKHDNNPQIPNNVIESIKKKTSSVHNFIFH